MPFPAVRPRRLRRTPALRSLVRETALDPAQTILPIFVVEDPAQAGPITSLPGVSRVTAEDAAKLAAHAESRGVGGVLLFGIPRRKDDRGSSASDPAGPVQAACRAIRAAVKIPVMTDVCLCEYTAHGHCGLVKAGTVDNDATLPLLCEMAVSHAAAGAEVVAPSDMMDGRVAAIRAALDAAGFPEVAIMAYSAKSASAFYGPFREAAGSAPGFGDRRGYQMDPANFREALREIDLDVAEGADLVMVKPAGPCLDIVAAAAARSPVPVAAYQVSGEYLMIKAGAATGHLDERSCALESLLAIRRAGARVIITYYADRIAEWLEA